MNNRNQLGQMNSNHSEIVNDPLIQSFIQNCSFPSKPYKNHENASEIITSIKDIEISKKHILTVEGSYSLVNVKSEYPSSIMAFFQFGAILFSTEDLQNLSEVPFIAPEDIKKLHNLRRRKLVLPVKNILIKGQNTLNRSIRKTIYDFFMNEKTNDISLMETLAWIVFEEYSNNPKETYVLSSNPNLNSTKGELILDKSLMSSSFTFKNEFGEIFLSDVFRLHEVIDEEFGATGILGYISRLVEQIILFGYLRVIYSLKSSVLKDFIFISNGPLSFSGQTANMHKPFRNLCNFLKRSQCLNLVGIEKSGPFIEHAVSICTTTKEYLQLEKGKALILSNEYIYKYITPGDHNRMHYGLTSYYGGKVIINTDDSQVFVISLPVENVDVIKSPKIEDFETLNEIVAILKLLKCDMYQDSIIPLAIANKLVSLTSYQSNSILEKFAKDLLP